LGRQINELRDNTAEKKGEKLAKKKKMGKRTESMTNEKAEKACINGENGSQDTEII
jgi:hypothetical protein